MSSEHQEPQPPDPTIPATPSADESSKSIGEQASPPNSPRLEREDLKPPERGETWMMILTGAIALSAIVQAVLFGWQLHVMDRQLEEMASATSVSKDTARRQLRAYVGIAGAYVEKPEDGTGFGKNGRLVILAKNFGQTPAKDVEIFLCRAVIRKPKPGLVAKLPDDFDFLSTHSKGQYIIVQEPPQSRAIIDPGSQKYNVATFDDNTNIFSDSFNAQFTMYFYGHIKYTDIYEIRRMRHFFFLYTPTKEPKGNLSTMETQNHEDEITKV